MDPDGNLYATHFRNTEDCSSGGNDVGRNVIGRADGTAWFTGEDGASYNGMKWTPNGDVYLADVGLNKVVKLNTQTMEVEHICGGDSTWAEFGAPNDLALARSGDVFVSGQQWGTSAGVVMLCQANGGSVVEIDRMGRTNGIALSPDDSTLYVTEAVGSPVSDDSNPEGQRIWKYRIQHNSEGVSFEKSEFFNFATDTAVPEATVDADGMRTDVAGNLYVTRNGNSKVTVIASDGTLVTELPLTQTNNPTNLAFGGERGDLIFVVGRCAGSPWSQGEGCVDVVQALRPGREWSWMRQAKPQPEPVPQPQDPQPEPVPQPQDPQPEPVPQPQDPQPQPMPM